MATSSLSFVHGPNAAKKWETLHKLITHPYQDCVRSAPFWGALVLALLAADLTAQTPGPRLLAFKRTEDIIYGRKFGVALTFDILQPARTNGFGVLWMVSGGFYSSHEAIQPDFYKELLARGYTVFAVVHGSQPKFHIPEIVEDIHRAVRFVRHHARDYGIDSARLGISGGSAGGYLSLTMGTQGAQGKSDAKDPIDRQSSAVQALACFFPPTDFLNWGALGVDAVGVGPLAQFKTAFGPRSDSADSRQVYGREISPLNFVGSNLPPTLIIHGDADRLVPIQQAEIFVKRAQENRVPVKLVVREGKDHGWGDMAADVFLLADWFDEHLRGVKKP